MFKVPQMFQWIIVATGSKHLEDGYKAPDNVLSSMKAIEDVSLVSDFQKVNRVAECSCNGYTMMKVVCRASNRIS